MFGGSGLIRNLISSVTGKRNWWNRTILAVVLLSSSVVLGYGQVAVSSGSGNPEIIDLNGEWNFTYTASRLETPPKLKEYKAKVSVPGSWDDSFSQQKLLELWPQAQFNPDYKELRLPVAERFDNAPDASLPFLIGTGWYHRTLDIPRDWRKREVVLNVGRVVMEIFVFVNGKQIYQRLGLSTPSEILLTPYLEFGRKNELVIAVDNRREDRIGTSIRGWKGRSAGIFGPVSLKVSPMRIADLFVYPDGDRLSWRVELSGKTLKDSKLQWRVVDPNTGHEYDHGIQPVYGNLVSWFSDQLEVPRWSDKNPKLIELQVRLGGEGQVYDEIRQPFGLRRLTRDGVGLKLNDTPIFLRGVCEMAYFPETCTPPLDIDWYRRHVKRLKDIGFNWLRGHTWPLNEQYLTAADELGMLVQVEPPSGFEIAEWVDIIRSSRKHPSVVLYCPGNEELIDEQKITFLKNCADTLKGLSPDALFNPMEAMRGVEYYLDGIPPQHLSMDPFPHHPKRLGMLKQFSDVFGQYPLGLFSYTSLQGSVEEIDRRLAIYEHPILSHELGISGTYLDLSLEKRYQHTRIGPDLFRKVRESIEQAGLSNRAESYYKNSVAWHMLMIKYACEKARRSPYIAGYDMLGAADAHWHRSGYACGLLNEFDELKYGTTASDILSFNGPSVLMIDRDKERNLTAEETVERNVYVSWFGDGSLPSTTLRWSLVTSDGEQIMKGEVNTPSVQPGKSERVGTVRMTLPEIQRPVKTKLRVVLSAPGAEIENSWDYWIFPRVIPKAHGDVMIVSGMDSTALQYLANGGRIILLGNEPFTSTRMNFQIGVAGRPEQNLATVIEKHPLTDFFPHDGFCDWQFFAMIDNAVPIEFNNLGVTFDPIIEVVSSYKRIRKQALVFEWAVGQGRLLVCGLNLENKDPATEYFRQLLLDYALSDQFRPETHVSAEFLARLIRQRLSSIQNQKETDKGFDRAGQLQKKDN